MHFVHDAKSVLPSWNTHMHTRKCLIYDRRFSFLCVCKFLLLFLRYKQQTSERFARLPMRIFYSFVWFCGKLNCNLMLQHFPRERQKENGLKTFFCFFLDEKKVQFNGLIVWHLQLLACKRQRQTFCEWQKYQNENKKSFCLSATTLIDTFRISSHYDQTNENQMKI